MFEIPRTDFPWGTAPTDRKTKKKLRGDNLSIYAPRPSSTTTITTITSNTTTTTITTGPKKRPSILNLLNLSRKDFSSRPTSTSASKLTISPPQIHEGSQSTPNFFSSSTIRLPSSPLLPPSRARSPLESFLAVEVPEVEEREEDEDTEDGYSPFAEPSFSSWATRSVCSDSSFDSLDESQQDTDSHLVQPLSPTSFVFRRTGPSVSSSSSSEVDDRLSQHGDDETYAELTPRPIPSSASPSCLNATSTPLAFQPPPGCPPTEPAAPPPPQQKASRIPRPRLRLQQRRAMPPPSLPLQRFLGGAGTTVPLPPPSPPPEHWGWGEASCPSEDERVLWTRNEGVGGWV